MSNSVSNSIPVRRVEVKNASDMPSRYSETPGGTIFSTTPGGSRIIYERKFLLNLKASPLSQTPTRLPVIPGVTLDDNGKLIEEDTEVLNAAIMEEAPAQLEEKKPAGDDIQFDMDI